jgi:bifunctional non-homologous end joining protein LigD
MLWRTPTTKRRPPGFVEPCIPTLVSKPPEGPQWIHEIKHDGYRLIARKRDDRVRLFTRRSTTGPIAIPASARPWRACRRHRPRSTARRCGATGRAWRKERLKRLLARAPAGIHYTEHLEGDGAVIFAHACRFGAEGIVSKQRDHPYRSEPSKAWLKTKNPAAPGVLRFREEP